MKYFSSTYRFFAIVLSLLILTSSVGVSVDIHFCQEKLSDISFSTTKKDTDNCEKEENSVQKCCQKDISLSELTLKKHSDCCTTNTIVTQSNVNTSLIDTSIEIKKIQTSLSVIIDKISYITDNEVVTTKKEVLFLNYSPLLLTKDIVILAEQFLC